jgi:hypothetical protein
MRIHDLNYVTPANQSIYGGIKLFRNFGNRIKVTQSNFSQNDSSSQSGVTFGGKPIVVGGGSSSVGTPVPFLEQLFG